MYYNEYHFFGMHFIWWFVWVVLLFWIFVSPYDIPGQRTKKDLPLEILKKRYASCQINKDEFHEMRKVLLG